MKSVLFAVWLLALFPHTGFAQEEASRLSPLTWKYLQSAETAKNGMVPGYAYKVFDGRNYMSALIKVSPGFSDESLKPLGVLIGTRAGNIWTARIPVENVVAFTRIPGIIYIQLDEPAHAVPDSAGRVTPADPVQEGAGTPVPFSGKSVVAGMANPGPDCESITLWDTGGTHYRIKRHAGVKSHRHAIRRRHQRHGNAQQQGGR